MAVGVGVSGGMLVGACALVVGCASLRAVFAPAAVAVEARRRAAELRLATGEPGGRAAADGAGGVVGAATLGIGAGAAVVTADDVAVVGGAFGGRAEDGVGFGDGVEFGYRGCVVGVMVGVVGFREGVE